MCCSVYLIDATYDFISFSVCTVLCYTPVLQCLVILAVHCLWTDRSVHPYCAPSQQAFLDWNVGKRRAAEVRMRNFADLFWIVVCFCWSVVWELVSLMSSPVNVICRPCREDSLLVIKMCYSRHRGWHYFPRESVVLVRCTDEGEVQQCAFQACCWQQECLAHKISALRWLMW